MTDAREARKTPLELRPEWRESQRTTWWAKYGMVPAFVAGAVALAGLVGVKVLGFQTVEAAQVQTEKTESSMHAADTRIEAKTDAVVGEVKIIGRDVKAIKCLMLAPNTKAKVKCGVDP
jgi:hypothetical protein